MYYLINPMVGAKALPNFLVGKGGPGPPNISIVRSLWATRRVVKEHTIAIYQNIERAAEIIVDEVLSLHVFTGDVGSHTQ